VLPVLRADECASVLLDVADEFLKRNNPATFSGTISYRDQNHAQ